MLSLCRISLVSAFWIAIAATASAEQLTFKNAGEEAIRMEFHRRGEKEEPRIPLPLKPGEERKLKPQEEAFYGLVITDHDGNLHRIGYRRMRGLTVKHPGAVIEVRPEFELVEVPREVVVMVPVIRKVVGEDGMVKEVLEYRPEIETRIDKVRQISGFDIVLVKEGGDELSLEFRKFAKPPKEDP